MNSLTLVASANSRLHADVILVRLRRAEIECRKISVLFPVHSMPNAVGCWLPLAPSSPLKLGRETIARAGQFRKPAIAPDLAHEDGREIISLLTHAGIDPTGAHLLAERLDQGHILLCVHADREVDASIAWHVFRHAGTDTMVVGAMPAGRPGRRSAEISPGTPWIPAAA